MSLYITYAHADKTWAENFILRLRNEGYAVEDILILLEVASHVLVIGTPTAFESEHVLNDIAHALEDNVPVAILIPDTLQTTALWWIPRQYAHLPTLDFAQADAYDRLQEIIGQPPRSLVVAPTLPAPPLWKRISAGAWAIVALVILLVLAISLPNDAPLPPQLGYGLISLIAFGIVALTLQAAQQAWQMRQALNALKIPPAQLKIIDSQRKRDLKRSWHIKRPYYAIGSAPDDPIFIRGLLPEQCWIVFDEDDRLFYLETGYDDPYTVLHDQLLTAAAPLPIHHGDIITVSGQIALQFLLVDADLS